MDAHLQWKVSPNVETLVRAIDACKAQLLDGAKRRNVPVRVTYVSCDTFADKKLVELLRHSDACSDTEAEEDDPRRTASSCPVATFPGWTLHSHDVVGPKTIRVVLEVDLKEGGKETCYGNVDLVT